MTTAEPEPADVLITGGVVVTLDDDHALYEDGAVAVRGSRIAAVGPAAEVGARFTAGEVIDASGRVVLPGLINAHTHAGDALFRGLFDDLPLEPWLERLWVVERRFLNRDTVRLGARLGYAEMIRAGITTALDMFFFPEAGAEVAREIGLRLMTRPRPVADPGPHRPARQGRPSRSVAARRPRRPRLRHPRRPRALGLDDEIGSLEPGKRADLILLDLDRPHLTPLYDVYSHLVYAAGRADVSTVMVHGRIVMRDRELLTVDETRAIEGVRELSRGIAAFVAG